MHTWCHTGTAILCDMQKTTHLYYSFGGQNTQQAILWKYSQNIYRIWKCQNNCWKDIQDMFLSNHWSSRAVLKMSSYLI